MPRGATPEADYDNNLFINCPFDEIYRPIFHALIFAAMDCGFSVRCALEVEDSGQVRFENILKIIAACRLGLHDISRTELDGTTQLPRFNMPFELGLFLAAGRFGAKAQRRKVSLILDRDKYRYQSFISDIAGQDIAAHRNEPEMAIGVLRRWLSALPRQERLPGGASIVQRYRALRAALPGILDELEIEADEMTFADYVNILGGWLAEVPRPRR